MTDNTIEFRTTHNEAPKWVMKITADRRIEVNEDVEVTEAAKKVLEAMQYLLAQQRTWVGLTDEELINVKKDAERYRWLRKEYAESRETYLAECVPSESALDEYIDRQMAKTSIKTERWSGK